MKKIIPIFLCLIIGGCSSYRYEYFTSPYILPTEEIQADPYIKTSADGFGIPFIAWRSTRGAPYDLELAFISRLKPEESILLSSVKITNTKGEEHQLLNEEVMIQHFNKRWFGGSHASLGTYRGDVFEAKRLFRNLPLEFVKGKACTIEAQFTVGSKPQTKQWKLGCDLRKKTQNSISALRSI